ncbi:MAG TPA: TonB-dependent receptor [Thermoanaerobaculia bacterium]|jgi:iron complex outermembrane receptor protein/vitamin B12 transporter|nr:TonB-dependent receptor [Thermoanaerobaculia bacterium]
MKRRLVLGSLFLASAALAQQPPAGSFYETATVQARPLSSATGSVTVIGREEIEASGALTVAEVLRSAPGLTITTNGTRGGLTTASIRGGDPNFTLVLLDGVPLNDPVYQEGDVFDLEGLPAEGVERIEIVRGPLSSFYGSTGLAGVIQIFTRGGDQASAQAEISGGDASFRKGTATVTGSNWSATALWEEEAERVAQERFQQAGGLASLSVPIGTAKLSLKARGTSWEGDDYPDASGGPVYGSGDLRHADHEELSLATGLSFGDRHELTASVYRHDMERDSPAVFPLVPPSTEDTRFTRTRVGWTSVLRTFQGGRWSAGVDAQRESGKNDSLLLLPEDFGGAVAGDYDIDRTVAGAYTELIADRGPWTFELGSRVDVPEEGGAEWSPRLGFGWRPVEGVRVHASAGRAWKLPSFFALASPRALGGNPDLKPETVIGGDLGADWRLAHNVDAGLTLFYNRYQDLVDFDFEQFLHVNRSEVETRGVEGSLGWHPSDRLSFQANATWQDFEDLKTHAKLRHRPEWTGGVRVLWKPAPAYSLDADVQAVSRFFDEQIPVPERDTVEARELVGLGAAWRFSHPWELRLRVDNLLGEEYETLIGFPGADRSVRLGLRWKS